LLRRGRGRSLGSGRRNCHDCHVSSGLCIEFPSQSS
jgi:hypothetical protein